MKATTRYVWCPVCKGLRSVTKSGAVRKHTVTSYTEARRFVRVACEGSGQPGLQTLPAPGCGR